MSHERIIPHAERLVPEGYRPDIAAAIVRSSGDPYRGYPEKFSRVYMTEEEYTDWVAAGRPAEQLFRKREAYIENHPNRLTPVAQAKRAQDESDARENAKNESPVRTRIEDYDGTQKFPEGTFGLDIVTDSHGAPLHPYLKDMLLAGVVATGPGFYWRLGENPAADPLVMRIDNGQLQMLVITREDSQTQQRHDALPGGMQDPEDHGLSQTLERELHEEAGVDPEIIRAMPRIEDVYSGVTGDPRATAHAWPTTRLDVLLPTAEQLVKMGNLRAGDDAVGIHWMTVSSANVDQLFAMHPELVKMGVAAWQEKTGQVVDMQGRVGKPQK